MKKGGSVMKGKNVKETQKVVEDLYKHIGEVKIKNINYVKTYSRRQQRIA